MTGRDIGTYWPHATMSWLERLGLKSFADHGHPVTVFSEGPLQGLPPGVICRRAVWPNFLEEICQEFWENSSAPGGQTGFLVPEADRRAGLLTDLFRLHLLAANPGMIWVDPGVVCLRPFDGAEPHRFGLEPGAEARLSGSVLALPADGAMLADLLALVGDRFAIPPYLKPKQRRPYAEARAAGHPIHVRDQPPGVRGGRLIGHFAQKHRLIGQAAPAAVYSALLESDAGLLLRRARKLAEALGPEARALRLWPAIREDLLARRGGVPPPGSWLADLAARHRIDPVSHPLPVPPVVSAGSGARDQGDPLAGLGLTGLTSLADLGGGGLALALAAQARFDCDLTLIDADGSGGFPAQQSDWVAPYLAALAAEGIGAGRVSVVRSAAGLRPVDLLVNLAGYGDRHKIRALEPFLSACLHADSRLLVDIRKGSGGFPFLAGHGETETLHTRDLSGAPVARVLFRPRAPEPAAPDDGWASIARGLAGPDGFYRANDTHSFLFVPRGRTLVVTFDNLDIAMNKREDRRPWGFSFIEKQGWSMLGVMANGWTWYRDPWVAGQFDDLAAQGFFAGFERVVFYGASMGGYAACAFSSAAPGAYVVAISPQSTVDKAVVPWESRYKTIWSADFSGKYGDAALVSGAARRVSLLYDPHEPLDAGHADRFTAANVMKLRANLLGHRLGSSLQQMGILTPIILGALGGTLTEAAFYKALRARKTFARYQRELFLRAVAAGHTGLARRLGAYILRQGDNRFIRLALQDL